MAKVINNTPTDPLVYLCTLLERKVEKRKMTGSAGISAMRKSASDMDGRMRGTAGAWATTSVGKSCFSAKEQRLWPVWGNCSGRDGRIRGTAGAMGHNQGS